MVIVNIKNQYMHFKDDFRSVVEGSQEFVQFKFNLSAEWQGLTIFAQFIQGGIGYNQYLDNDGCVFLPPEIKRGNCQLLLFGTGRNRTVATSNALTFVVEESKMIRDGQSVELSQSLYQQLIDRFETQIIPQRGVDYWTAEDKQEIINSVLAEIPTGEGAIY